MDEGDVVKAFVPQADGQYKARPAVLVLKLPYFDDWLICGISGQTHYVHDGFDILIDHRHPDYSVVGLPFPSVIRAGWLYAFPESKIEGAIGAVSAATLSQLKHNLRAFLGNN